MKSRFLLLLGLPQRGRATPLLAGDGKEISSAYETDGRGALPIFRRVHHRAGLPRRRPTCSAAIAGWTISTSIIPTSFSSTRRGSSSASCGSARNGSATPSVSQRRAAIAQHPPGGQLHRRTRHQIFRFHSSSGSKPSPASIGTVFDQLDGDSFNVPFILGGTYIYTPEVQFVFGVGVNFQGRYPVLPGGGIRWKFAPDWTLNAVLPTPRLEYEFNRNLTFFAGADIKANTFRVDDQFRRQPRRHQPEQRLAELRRSAGRGRGGMENQLLAFPHARGRLRPVSAVRFPSHRGPLPLRSGAPYGALMLHGEF